MPGWQEDTSQCRTYQELPVNARNYVEKIEELVNVPGMVYCIIIINSLLSTLVLLDYSFILPNSKTLTLAVDTSLLTDARKLHESHQYL